MKTRDDLQHELNVSAATVANWLKTGLIPAYAPGTAGYDEPTYQALKTELLTRHGKLQQRANRSQHTRQATHVNPPESAPARQVLAVLAQQFHQSKATLSEFMLVVCLACLQRRNLAQIRGRTISSGSHKFTRFLRAWQADSGTDVAGLVALALPYCAPGPDTDFLGTVYEALRTLAEKAAFGAFFTPRRLVADVQVPTQATVLDPCAGTGSLLMGLLTPNHLPQHVHLHDIDELALRIATVNFVLFFNSAKSLVNTECRSALVKTQEPVVQFDFVVSNPPYGVSLTAGEKKVLQQTYPELGNTESFGIALVNALARLKPGGKLFFLLPESFLYVDAHRNLRALVFSPKRKVDLRHFGLAFKGVQSRIVRVEVSNIPSDGIVLIRKEELTWHAPLQVLQQNDYRPPFIHTRQEMHLLRKVWYSEWFSLAHCGTFGLGIVTGNNRHCLRNEPGEPGFEPVYKGKELLPFRFKQPENYIRFRPETLQQVAPERLYRQPKICYRFISDSIVTAADSEGKLLLNSLNFFVPGPEIPLQALSAFLNSALVTFFFRRAFNANKVLRSHLERIPVPKSFYAHAATLTHLYKKAEAGHEVYDELNAFVCSLYDLTEEETRYIAEAVRPDRLKKQKLPGILAA